MQIINDLYNFKNIYIHVYHIVCVCIDTFSIYYA